MKIEITQLDSRNLDDWDYLGALAGRMRRFDVIHEATSPERTDERVRATLAQWVQAPDTVGVWAVVDNDIPHIEGPGDDWLGYAVAYIQVEAGELSCFLWQMAVDAAARHMSTQLAERICEWARSRGAMQVEMRTERSPRAIARRFGCKLAYHTIIKEL